MQTVCRHIEKEFLSHLVRQFLCEDSDVKRIGLPFDGIHFTLLEAKYPMAIVDDLSVVYANELTSFLKENIKTDAPFCYFTRPHLIQSGQAIEGKYSLRFSVSLYILESSSDFPEKEIDPFSLETWHEAIRSNLMECLRRLESYKRHAAHASE